MLKHLSTNEIKKLLWQHPWFIEAKIELYKRGELQSSEVALYIMAGYMKANTYSTKNQHKLPSRPDGTIQPDIDISQDSVSQSNMPISETLAQIYIAQGLLNQAQDTYKQLCLIFPEKSAYFASKIQELNNNKF